MLRKLMTSVLLLSSGFTQAGLSNLNNDDMQSVVGQGGADLNWTLSLNHKYANDMSLNAISTVDSSGVTTAANYGYACTNNVLCRLAIAPNNHADSSGNKKWLVFKQIQGTLQIDKFSLDGSTILNKDSLPQTAMKLSFYDDKPLKIRNLGFSSLAVETDKTGEAGYLDATTYAKFNSTQDVPAFDKGAETGFMGLNMHGNLHMSGNLKIFSYNCAGTATSRC
ncbi:hypothetical protein [Acinetobacter bouvetii]|uniref:Uncharacterized protein n=1 Tax=Acinetobacter bouvetii TaxID=202951 RepID=A0A811GDB8_9GAMM|nr:hypothetical protein [Acinetobacter bouvetii]CAB1216200.1 hypothetical protein SFB21_1913 [Acinetobacter bouvetii]